MKPARPDDIPQSTHESTQTILGVELRTYVLDDGRRIIHADDFHRLMAVLTGKQTPTTDDRPTGKPDGGLS